MVHVPAPSKLTTPLEIEHTPAEDASMVKATERPEVAVAVAVYVGPETLAADGAVDVNEMVWSLLETPKDCCTCGAAL
jgi:hypothetical protein